MAILIHDPTYKDLSGFTGEKAPYPNPLNLKETQENLKFFRAQANLSQRKAASLFNVSKSALGEWECSYPSKGIHPINPSLLAVVAKRLKCNADLINPACPMLYKESYTKYPPILINGQVVHCIEQPETVEETINNVNYFMALADMSAKAMATRLNCSPGSLSRWRIDTPLKESMAIDLAQVLQCPKELIYLEKILRPNDKRALKGADYSLTLISPPQSLNDLKNNLAYYVAKANMTPRDVARMLGLSDNDSGYQTFRNWKRFDTSAYMDISQALTLANRLNIPAYDIMPLYQQSPDATKLKSNLSDITHSEKVASILSLAAYTNVSGGPAIELEPSQWNDTLSEALNLPQWESKTLAIARVIGDSMYNYETGEGIADGSFILADTSVRDFNQALDKIVCFRINGNELLIKRLRIINGHLCFWSDNPRYTPRYYQMPEDANMLGLVLTAFKQVF